MAWSKRGNRAYFYRSRRVGRRGVREYVGQGVEADLAAALLAERVRQRAESARRRRAEAARHAAVERLLDGVDRAAEALLGGLLALAGYRRHDRGPWRK